MLEICGLFLKCIEDELGILRTSYKSNKNTRYYMFHGDKKTSPRRSPAQYAVDFETRTCQK